MAANLRPALTSVGPLIGEIRGDMGLSNGQAGAITTLPLIGFAALSILAPRLGHRFGNAFMLFAGLILLAVGILIRSFPSIITLYAGTSLLGLAIAVCNVLLPGLIKQIFPAQVGLMTGVYSASMGVFAALASGISITLINRLGFSWNGALVIWAILAVLAAFVWFPQVIRNQERDAKQPKIRVGKLWRSSLAWQVTFFMGFTSLAFYVTIAWLPEILIGRGVSVSNAGWMLSLAQLSGLPCSFLIPVLACRRTGQRLFVVIIGIFYIVGLLGLLSKSTTLVVLWVICIGIGQGASFSLALTLLSLRGRTSQQVAELSGMAQSLGYSLAAIGPMLFGYLRDFTGSWTLPLYMLIGAVLCLFMFGLGAARNQYVMPDTKRNKEAL